LPYGVEEMTFLKEEEVFPIVTDSDASKIVEDSSELSVSATSLKEETKEANNTSVVADGKRKLSDKPEEKKVCVICLTYITGVSVTQLNFSHRCYFHLEMSTSFGEKMTSLLTSLFFQEANKPPDSWFELKVNTHVYVTGLPEDVTVDEVSINFCLILPESTYLPCKN
jgi:HIV Tat-specific factor 1